MADILLPQTQTPAEMEWRLVDSTATFRSTFSGKSRTLERSGARWSCRVRWPLLNGADRRALMAFAASLRGKANRAMIYDPTTVNAGSMAAPELLTNNLFANGTTGWSTGSQTTLSASNGVLRAKRNTLTASQPSVASSSASTGVAYAPHALRSLTLAGRGSFTGLAQYLGSTSTGSDYFQGTAGSAGYKSEVSTPSGTSLFFTIADTIAGAAGRDIGDYFDVPFTSLSRAAQLDSGGNLLLQSDVLGTTWTATNVTIATNSGTAPDGTVTADGLQETAVTGGHSVQQAFTLTTAAQDVAFAFAVKAGSRGFAALEVSGGAGSASSYINLSTGAVSSTGSASNWSNPRAYATSLGNGWWYFCLVARKTDATTACTARLYAATAAGTSNYLGVTGSDAIIGWRGTLVVSSQPVRLVSTTTTAVAASTQSGTGVYVKGLPASTNGLLLAGDRVEVNGQLVMATAPLDSDASGRGYLQCSPPIRSGAPNDAPVVFQTPMMRAILVGEDVGWNTGPGLFSDFELSFEEDVA